MGPKRKADAVADVVPDGSDNAGEGSSKPKQTRRQKEEQQSREKTDKYWAPAQVRDAALRKSNEVVLCDQCNDGILDDLGAY
jgi:hypothetical protein